MFAHVHLGHLPHGGAHHDLRRVVREAVVAAELGAAAFVVVSAVEAGRGTAVPEQPPAVTQVVTTPAGMTATVDVVDAAGDVVGGGVLIDRPLRVEGLEGGTYHLVVRGETPLEQTGEVGISAASALRTDPFPVQDGGSVVISAASAGRG